MDSMMDMSMPPADVASARDDAQIKDLQMISMQRSGKMTEKQMHKIANQFETMLFRQLMKEMRKTIHDGEGLFKKSHAQQMYQDIADDHMVEHLAASGDLGIEGMVYAELKERNDSIVDLKDVENKDNKDDFVSLNKADAVDKDDFVDIGPSDTNLVDIKNPTQWVDIPNQGNEFHDLDGHTRLNSDNIKDL